MLTSRQTTILSFIESHIHSEGVSPTVVEIQNHFALGSPASVSEHLTALERKGAIRRVPGQARNIRLTAPGKDAQTLDIPVFGAIPAGFAEIAGQQSGRTMAFDPALLPTSNHTRLFALEVRGDSMTGAGIFDGDLVILEHGLEPVDGDIVVALIDGESTLKRYRVRNRRPWLQAENAAYPDLIPAAELTVQGIFRALVRVPMGGSHASR